MMIRMITIVSLCLALFSAGHAFAAQSTSLADPTPDWKYAARRMKKAGFGPKFIQRAGETYETARFAQVLELNLLLFLKKSDYHGIQVSDSATRDVRGFMNANSGAIKRAEREHGVPGSVIASLLWLESRHGQNKGEFHVPSAYIHLLQAERLSVQQHLQKSARNYTKKVTPKARKEITKRTKRKAEWALAELKAIQTMHRRNRKTLPELRGSFAGAFGMPQFIPSSYVTWAQSTSKKRPADLTRADDAILSVGNYLRLNGWKKKLAKSHLPALMKYNNSKDYANAILKLAKFVNKGTERVPSAAEENP